MGTDVVWPKHGCPHRPTPLGERQRPLQPLMTYGFTIQEAVHPTVMPPPPQPPPGNTNAMAPLTALPRPSANGHQIPPDADSQGFVGYPGVRRYYTNPAVVMGRTADSFVVICQTGVGRFYYLVPALVSDFADFRRHVSPQFRATLLPSGCRGRLSTVRRRPRWRASFLRAV